MKTAFNIPMTKRKTFLGVALTFILVLTTVSAVTAQQLGAHL